MLCHSSSAPLGSGAGELKPLKQPLQLNKNLQSLQKSDIVFGLSILPVQDKLPVFGMMWNMNFKTWRQGSCPSQMSPLPCPAQPCGTPVTSSLGIFSWWTFSCSAGALNIQTKSSDPGDGGSQDFNLSCWSWLTLQMSLGTIHVFWNQACDERLCWIRDWCFQDEAWNLPDFYCCK